MTTTQNCPDESLLSALIADQLTAEETARLTAHLDTCESCQARLTKLESLPMLGCRLSDLKNSDRDVEVFNRLVTPSNTQAEVETPNEPSVAKSDQRPATSEVFTCDGFDILRTIGQGGMGVVFLARERSLDRLVAIKVLSPHLAGDPAARQRFLREARSAASVVHPNVIAVHAVSENLQRPFLVMEYVDGVSLRQSLDLGNRFSASRIAKIASQLCAALGVAHSRGIVHRDVKPGNIMLSAQTGDALLGDFGLAKSEYPSNLTMSGTIVGTPGYVAPELLESDAAADHRADLFSLGAVLYATCTGSSPFQADSLMGTLHRVATFEPVDLATRNADIPAWLSNIVMRLLSKDPNDRYQCAADVLEALKAGNAGIPMREDSTSNVQPPTVIERSVQRPSGSKSFPVLKDAGSKRVAQRGRSKTSAWVVPAMLVFGIVTAVALPVVVIAMRDNQNQGSSITTANGRTNDATGRRPASVVPIPDAKGMFANGIDDEAPFVLLDGKMNVSGRFGSAEEAFEHLTPGCTVEIHSNEEIVVEQYVVEAEGVTIRAADGYSPTVQFDAIPDDEHGVHVLVEGSLTMLGLEFELPVADEDEDDEDDHVRAMIGVANRGSLRMINCKLVVEGEGYCLVSDAAAKIELEHCHLHAPEFVAIKITGRGGNVAINETWVTGETAFQVEEINTHELTIRSGRLVCETAFEFNEEESDARPSDWRIGVSESLVYCARSLVEVDSEEVDMTEALGQLARSGQGNQFGGNAFGGTEWARILSENQSRYVEHPFQFGAG